MTEPTQGTPAAPPPPKFEESLADLDRLVRELEDGRLGLDDSLARYEQGVGLIKQCYAQLRQAEQRILTLTGVQDDGTPALAPFQHEATAGPAAPAPAPRVVRRKANEV